ncbi:Uncharacterized protein FWK35_00020048 [Aphis craccivora]|uniref:Uncharacterized protein n=1 Tax=Aphis craccivora TaxID=307492 RepID=A0A6G0Y5V7_APHCR|nr:Uncharacterized protein FWK35_00020048 [Aphis craccivora]
MYWFYYDVCVFFFCVCLCTLYSITSRNNPSISNLGGGFRRQSEYPWCDIEVKKVNKIQRFSKKIDKNKKKK